MHNLTPYRQATPQGEPIFIFNNGDNNQFVKATNLQEYEYLRNNSLNLSQNLNIPKHCFIEGIPQLMDDREYIAYSHLYVYNSFQYTMQKQLLGFAHIQDVENKQILVFEKNKNLEDFLYFHYGRNFNNVNFFEDEQYDKLHKMLSELYYNNKIEPIFIFKDLSYELIEQEIKNSKKNPVKFLNKNTPLSFN